MGPISQANLWQHTNHITGQCLYISLNIISLRPSDAYMHQQTNHHWFRYWLVDWTVPNHYQNQCCNIVSWTLRNKAVKFLIVIQIFLCMKMPLKLSSAKWQKFLDFSRTFPGPNLIFQGPSRTKTTINTHKYSLPSNRFSLLLHKQGKQWFNGTYQEY